ncbi:MAG: hypothetical protein IJZ83_05800 [Clostridia bacterium]|nr:hypothetical protein [Clostridia bacterium]MBR4013865.1 hypothetical protein [Clostridia bacterium]
MLKVLPVQSKLTQEEICIKCGVKYNADLLAYAAYVDDRLAGVCQFKLTDKGGIIYDLAPTNDFYSRDALFVMGRGALNFIDLCGVHFATYKGSTEDEPLILQIGFKKTEQGEFEINLEGFFTDHCH